VGKVPPSRVCGQELRDPPTSERKRGLRSVAGQGPPVVGATPGRVGLLVRVVGGPSGEKPTQQGIATFLLFLFLLFSFLF
jgi:hypothetical protein